MASFTKIFNSIIFSVIIGDGIIMAMEPKVTHTLMISSHIKHAAYATPEFHSTCTPTNLPSHIKDPIIRCTATNIETNKRFRTYIAAKHLLKPKTKEPLIEIRHTNRNYHHFNITARCVQNPKLQGNDFLEQLRNIMVPFYKKPEESGIYVYDEKSMQKDPISFSALNIYCFEQAHVLKIKKIIISANNKVIYEINKKNSPNAMLTPQQLLKHSGETIKQKNIWEHGPNGCPNEETLLKSITQ